MISDTDSDDDLMMPNGFVDLGADKVQCDFESGTSPPLKKKCVQKKKSQSSNSLGSSQTEPIEAAVLPFSTTETEGLHSWEPIVLETTDDTAENRGPRRSKRITKSSYSSKPTSKKTSFTRSYNESTIVLNSGEASPEVLNDVSTSLQSSFCFDEEDVSIHTAEESPIDDEVKVRVVWKGCETHTFTLRKFQKIKEIYTHFAKQEGVEEDRILFTLRDKPVGPQDSPSTLNIGVTFLEGGVTDVVSSNRVNQNVDSESPGDPNALKLFVQRRGLRDKHTVFTYRHEKISILISKLTEELKIPNGSFKLVFDGDALEINKTPEDYDMEGDECIDLIETQ